MKPDLIAFVDGGCTSNPGVLAVAAVACSDNWQIIVENAVHAGTGTNNVAEYRALSHGICIANLLGARRPMFCTDSDLVVKQINGYWAMRGNEELKEAHSICHSELMRFNHFMVRHIPRERNKRADWLVCKLLGHSRTPKKPPSIDPVEHAGKWRPGWSEISEHERSQRTRPARDQQAA